MKFALMTSTFILALASIATTATAQISDEMVKYNQCVARVTSDNVTINAASLRALVREECGERPAG